MKNHYKVISHYHGSDVPVLAPFKECMSQGVSADSPPHKHFVYMNPPPTFWVINSTIITSAEAAIIMESLSHKFFEVSDEKEGLPLNHRSGNQCPL